MSEDDVAAAKREHIVKVWREDYDTMSFGLHQAAYSTLWETGLTDQAHFDYEAVDVFSSIWTDGWICEIGGWDGQLAQMMLKQHPGLPRWFNYEVCREAAMKSVQLNKDDRYFICNDQWLWDSDLSPFATFVASHTLEHMSKDHLSRVIAAIDHFKHAYVQVPCNMGSPGVQSTHFLCMPVAVLREVFIAAGWRLLAEQPGTCISGDDVVMMFSKV